MVSRAASNITDGDNHRVTPPLSCAHRRASAEATIAHLRRLGLWGSWQYAALIGGRCPACQNDQDDQERAA